LWAALRHGDRPKRCPFPGEDRKQSADDQNDAIDVVDDARSRHRMCQRVIVEQRITGGVVQMQVSTIGVDLAKNVFQVHGVDSAGKVVITRQLRRKQVIDFFSKIPPCLVGMEACGTAHHWAREVSKLGHTVRLMPPSYVKGYVKRSKNDAADAAAICEAVTRPSMRFVPIKSADQQALLMLHRTRDLLIRQRTQLINALRAHLAEFGLVAATGREVSPCRDHHGRANREALSICDETGVGPLSINSCSGIADGTLTAPFTPIIGLIYELSHETVPGIV
jgi:hypothetical protein